MAQSVTSQWKLCERLDFDPNKKQASITLTKNYDTQSKPVSFSFQCARHVSWLDKKIFDIFIRAVHGKAFQDMQTNKICSHDPDAYIYGNTRGDLSECRCQDLDRISKPQIRHHYENRGIQAVLSILQKQNMKDFHLKLAIPSSDGLLGVQTFLFRLIHELYQRRAAGTIELFFIDPSYNQAVKNSNQDSNQLVDALGKRKDIEQFLKELCSCLPSSIKIQGTFFSDADTYIKLAQDNSHFKHDLLMGVSIKSSQTMEKVRKEAGLGAEPVVLNEKTAKIKCELKSSDMQESYPTMDSGPTQFVKELRTNLASQSTQQPSDKKKKQTLIIGGAVAATTIGVAALAVLGFSLRK